MLSVRLRARLITQICSRHTFASSALSSLAIPETHLSALPDHAGWRIELAVKNACMEKFAWATASEGAAATTTTTSHPASKLDMDWSGSQPINETYASSSGTFLDGVAAPFFVAAAFVAVAAAVIKFHRRLRRLQMHSAAEAAACDEWQNPPRILISISRDDLNDEAAMAAVAAAAVVALPPPPRQKQDYDDAVPSVTPYGSIDLGWSSTHSSESYCAELIGESDNKDNIARDKINNGAPHYSFSHTTTWNANH